MKNWYFINNEFQFTTEGKTNIVGSEYVLIKSSIEYDSTKVYGLVNGEIQIIREAEVDHMIPLIE